MKKLFLFASIMLLAACSTEIEQSVKEEKSVSKNSFRVSEDEAIERLEKMLRVFEPTTRGKKRSVKNIIAHRSRFHKTRAYAANIPDTLMYIINFDDENGYAVVSADKRANDFILALIDTGNYNPSTTINLSTDTLTYSELYNLLEEDEKDDFFCGQIHATIPSIEMIEDYLMSEMNNNIKYIINEIDTIVIEQVGPFLNTKWGQHAPYNWMCHLSFTSHFHLDKDATNCPTGCGATALAQVLAYHKYPSSANGYAYNWEALHQQRNFPDQDTIAGTYGIAHLMKSAGLASSMDYRLDTSLTTAKRIQKALKYSFGYNGTDKINRFAGTRIVNNLNTGALSIIFGCAKGKNIGHIWVIDGYQKYKITSKEIEYSDSSYTDIVSSKVIEEQEKYYFHCNYGWDGVADGYYLGKIFTTTQNTDIKDPYLDTIDSGYGPSDYSRWFRTVLYNNPNK